MTPDYILLLAAGAAAGGFINGLVGFGTGLFALGFWLQIMSPLHAVAMVLAMSVLGGAQGVFLVRKSINWPRLLRFLLPAIVGIPLGFELLKVLDPALLKIVIASFMILYGGFFAFRRGLPTFDRQTRVIDSIIGFVSGILGGAAGLCGALPTMWCAMRPWPKADQRALLQPFNVIILGITIILFAFKGAYDVATLLSIAIAFPVTTISARTGIWLFGKLADDTFRRLLILLMLFSGLILLARELI